MQPFCNGTIVKECVRSLFIDVSQGKQMRNIFLSHDAKRKKRLTSEPGDLLKKLILSKLVLKILPKSRNEIVCRVP